MLWFEIIFVTIKADDTKDMVQTYIIISCITAAYNFQVRVRPKSTKRIKASNGFSTYNEVVDF